MKIIGDILITTRDDFADDDGASVTYLIRKANISHVRISRILNNLSFPRSLRTKIHQKELANIELVIMEESF